MSTSTSVLAVLDEPGDLDVTSGICFSSVRFGDLFICLWCVGEASPAHVRRRRKERFHHVNKQAFVLFSPPDRQEEDGSRSSFFFVISSGKYTYLGSPGQRLGASQLFLISNVFSTSQLVRIILRPNLIRLNVNYPHKREPLSW